MESRSVIPRVIEDQTTGKDLDPWGDTREYQGKEQPHPTQIERYVIRRVLGRGGFGVVYLADDPDMDCQVAIKQLNVESVSSSRNGKFEFRDAEVEIDQLLKEAQLAAKLRLSPGVVPVLDVLYSREEDSISHVYIVQQYVEGGDLRSLMSNGRINPQQSACLIEQIAHAVGYAHERDIYHRDLKPGNILLDADGKPFVGDFGLAVTQGIQRKLRGEISGTVAYMSPEQTRGDSHLLDGRSDIWALGVIFYEMLTGTRPFNGETRDELCEEICQRDPRPPRMIVPQLPQELERIALKCLSKSITERYSTAFDLSADLENWRINRDRRQFDTSRKQSEDTDRQTATATAYKRRFPSQAWRWVLLFLVLIPLLGLGTLISKRSDFNEKKSPRTKEEFANGEETPLLDRKPHPFAVPSLTDQSLDDYEALHNPVEETFEIETSDHSFFTLGEAPDGRFLITTQLSKLSPDGTSGLFFGLSREKTDIERMAEEIPEYWSCHAIFLNRFKRGLGDQVLVLERHQLRLKKSGSGFFVVEDHSKLNKTIDQGGTGEGLLQIRVNQEKFIDQIRWNGENQLALVLPALENKSENWTCNGQFGIVNLFGRIRFSDSTLILE